jgi:hypothetical protein
MGRIDKFNDGFQETADQLAQATQELTEKTTEVVPAFTYRPETYAAIAQ